jgi:plastocyanin
MAKFQSQRADPTAGRFPGVPLAAVLTVTFGLGTGAALAQDAEPAAVVEMTDQLAFEPERITVRVGDTVEWRNPTRLPHTVTTDPEEAQDPEHVQLPEGAEPFNSGNIMPDETFSHTFNVAGEYQYFCIPHEMQGMLGHVTVEP